MEPRDLVKAYSTGEWINNWIKRRAELTPEWIALIDDATSVDRRITYRVLNNRVDKIAKYFKKEFRINKGDIIAMLSWARIEVLETLFAASKLGSIFFPLNTRYTGSELVKLLEGIKPKILIYEKEFEDKVSLIKEKLDIRYYVSVGQKSGDSLNYEEMTKYSYFLEKAESVTLEDPLMILQTGGTTGKPKAGIVTYRMIFWNALNTLRDLIVPGDITITALPLFHIGGYTYVIPLLMFGGTNFIMHRWNVEKFMDYVERERPSFLFLVPTQLKMLLEHPRFREADFSSVRWITSGGAALTKDIIKGIFSKGIVMKQGFGLTEMGPGVFALDPWDAERKMGSIGKPNLLVETKVIKKNGEKAGPNEEGELFLRGPSIFGGYWNMPDETVKTLKGGWLRTGDVVKYDDEGYYWVVGRSKNVIRSGAESIYPEEVEKVLRDHPKIEEVYVIGVPDEKWGEVSKAIIVLKKGQKITKDEVVQFCMDKLAKYKIPKYIQVVDHIPKTDIGKVSREFLHKKFGKPEDVY